LRIALGASRASASIHLGQLARVAQWRSSAEEVANFVAVSQRYGYVLSSPGENAAVGITMPLFAG
jgi:hypothetical protein